jgi:hypothetical protein
MNVAVDEAGHEKSPLRINLPTSCNWRAANGPDSVARNSDIVQPLKYGRAVEDSCVVNYEFARTIIVGSHLEVRFPPGPFEPRVLLRTAFPRQGVN